VVDGDWNDAAAIAAPSKGVEGAFVMLPAVWAPSPDYREAKGVTANYVAEAQRGSGPPLIRSPKRTSLPLQNSSAVPALPWPSKPRLRYSPGLVPTTRLNALLNAASDS
jgi:hypothetical protein